MSGLATVASVVGTGAAIVGTGAQLAGAKRAADGQIAAGEAEQKTQNALARQEVQLGKAEFAAAQRTARERQIELDFIQSSQRAAAASSGAGGSETFSVAQIISDTVARSQYGQDMDLWQGRETQRQYNRSARSRRRTGTASLIGRQFAASGTMLQGFGSAMNNIHSIATSGAFSG